MFEWGGVRLGQEAYSSGVIGESLGLLTIAVSGSARPPSREKMGKLVDALLAGKFKGATLGGAQFIAEEQGLLIVRDPGMVMGTYRKTKIETNGFAS